MNSRSTARLATPDLIDLSLQAAANQDVYGSVSQLARKHGVSRRVVRAIRDETVAIVAKSTTQPPCSTNVRVTHGHLTRCIVALYMVGRCSIWSIVDLLPVLFPGVKGGGFGTVQRLLVEAAVRAKGFNAVVDLSGVYAAGLDEMFSQGDPVLAGIDLDSNYIFLVEKHERRTTQDWEAALKAKKLQGLAMKVAVRDGGAAIAAGVASVYPDAEQRDDNLHAQMTVTKVLHKVENRAYSAMSRIEELKLALEKAQGRENPRPLHIAKLKGELAKATKRCDALMTEHEELTRLWGRLRAALELVDIARGTLRQSDKMREELEAVADALLGSRRRDTRKAGGYIKRRLIGLTNYADSVHAKLEPLREEFGGEAVATAMIVLQLAKLLKAKKMNKVRREQLKQLRDGLNRLTATGHADDILAAVAAILFGRHRASSAIESMNAALRTHLTIRKRTTDGFLHLFQAYFNLRVRRWGRFKSTSAWGLLTGQPAGDWLTHLGYPPAH